MSAFPIETAGTTCVSEQAGVAFSSHSGLLYSQWRTRVPVWHLAAAWVAALPLLFLAMGARLIPDTQDVGLRVSQMDESGATHKGPLAIVLLICATLVFRRYSQVFAACQRLKLVVAIPILALFSTLWSGIPGHTLMSAAILLLFTCFAVYLGIVYNHQRILELITLVGAIGVALSFLAVIFMPSIGGGSGGWRGIFGNKQNTACVVTFFLITALHWKPPTNLYRLASACYMLLCFVLIVMAQSRTGWGLCLLGLSLSACLLLFQKLPLKQALLIVLFCAPVVLAIAYGLYSYSTEILYAVGKDPTLNERTRIWAAAVESIGKQPLLGYGYAAFWQGLAGPSLNMILAAGWVLWQSQDGYLDLWLQVGVGGLLLLAALIFQAGTNALRAFKITSEGTYVRWCIVVLICALVYDIGESSLFMQRFSWFLFLLACIGLAQAARGIRVRA